MIKDMFINIIISLLVCSLCLYAYAQKHPPIAYVDVNVALKRAAIALSKTKLTEKAQTKLIKSYASNLDKTIKEYADKHNLFIVSAPILSSKALDVTNNIVRFGIKKEVLHV